MTKRIRHARLPEKLRKVLETRRSNAARPHRNRRRYHRPTQTRITKQEQN